VLASWIIAEIWFWCSVGLVMATAALAVEFLLAEWLAAGAPITAITAADAEGKSNWKITSLEVGEVRVKGNCGYVRLHCADVSERLVSVHRLGQGWRVAVLLDQIGV
jgi:hypothetical protein